mgnify:CR=1 FL=1
MRRRDIAREVAATGVPAVLVFAAPDHKDAGRRAARSTPRARRADASAHQGGLPAAAGVGGRVPCGATDPRALRPHHPGRRGRQRFLQCARWREVALNYARRRGRGRAERHDGQAGGGDPRTAGLTGRRGHDADRPPTRQSTRPLSTARSARRPSPHRPSGTGAPTRWTRPTRREARARGAAGCRGGRRPGHGQAPAGPYLGCHPPGARCRARAGGGLPGLRRVQPPSRRPPSAAGSTSAPRLLETLTGIRRAGAGPHHRCFARREWRSG